MEFYAVAHIDATEQALVEALTLEAMPEFCESIVSVEMTGEREGMCVTLWGDFAIRRDTVMGGVRFFMPGCPNCLGWTVTTGLAPEPDKVVVHAAINRNEHDPEFVASLEDFVEQWAEGLTEHFKGAQPVPETAKRPEASPFACSG